MDSLDLDLRLWPDRPWSDELLTTGLGAVRAHPHWPTENEPSSCQILQRRVVSGNPWSNLAGLQRGLVLGGGGQCGGVMGRAACRPPRPGPSWVLSDLDSSNSSLRSDDEESILGLLAASPPRSMRRVVRSTVSLPRALLQDSRLGVVSPSTRFL